MRFNRGTFVTALIKIYTGSKSNNFKAIYRNYKIHFKNKNKSHSTELANYIQNLKDSGTKLSIEWDIFNRIKTKFNYLNGCELSNLTFISFKFSKS